MYRLDLYLDSLTVTPGPLLLECPNLYSDTSLFGTTGLLVSYFWLILCAFVFWVFFFFFFFFFFLVFLAFCFFFFCFFFLFFFFGFFFFFFFFSFVCLFVSLLVSLVFFKSIHPDQMHHICLLGTHIVKPKWQWL